MRKIWLEILFASLATFCFGQSSGQAKVKIVSDRPIPIYSVEEQALGASGDNTKVGSIVYESIDNFGIRKIQNVSKLTLLGYTPVTLNMVPGVHTLQANYGDSNEPFQFKVNATSQPQIWKISQRNDIITGVTGAAVLVGLIGTIATFGPSVNEWQNGNVKTNSVVLFSSIGAFVLGLALSPLANPSAQLEK